VDITDPNVCHQSYQLPFTLSAHFKVDWHPETKCYFEYLIKKFSGDKKKFIALKQMLLANNIDFKAYKDLKS